MNEMNKRTLKPCPFCGSPGQFKVVDVHGRHIYWRAWCTQCDATISGRANHPEEMLAEWNRRAYGPNIAKPSFTVIDTTTGEDPDVEQIALKEPWAEGLIYCDIDGFYVGEDGRLSLIDECGNARWCPEGRFSVVFGEDNNN